MGGLISLPKKEPKQKKSGEKIHEMHILWIDEKINNDENQIYYHRLKTSFCNFKGYNDLLDEVFELFYDGGKFEIIYVIISGRFFGKYIQTIKDNIKRIINIPYTYIFTSNYFKKVLLKELPDNQHILSYDTLIEIKDDFFNPGGVYDDFDELFYELKNKKLNSNIVNKPRIKDKINYEGIFTFEYLKNEEDLLAPALYKDIITNEEITEKDCENFYNHILSFDNIELNNLIKNLILFKNIPFEILCKYWARLYTIESNFYKVLNNNLMKSKLTYNYKTFINMLYKGVEINSIKPYSGKYLYRGTVINKTEIEKINKYKSIGLLSNVVVFSKAFLSFSRDKSEAIPFCGKSDDSKLGCLYILENNNNNLHESNGDIQIFSIFPDEKEILFFPGSSFIIKNITKINNMFEITLNYNGKFKEKYSFIYDNKEKINNLINNNILTKNIAGQELVFLKGGKYLINGEKTKRHYGGFFKGKDLETDTNVSIKEIKENGEVIILKKISNKIKHSMKIKDIFTVKGITYIVEDYFDGDLNYYGHMPPNLIKKIFMQLNLTFQELLEQNIIHNNICPRNIYIKYTNRKKTNFDSILTGYGYFTNYKKEKVVKIEEEEEEEEESVIKRPFIGTPVFQAPEVLYGDIRKNSDLFSIGMTIFFLYSGKLAYIEEKSLKFKIEEDRQLEDLLYKLLKRNPDERINWEEYFTHPFFRQYEY